MKNYVNTVTDFLHRDGHYKGHVDETFTGKQIRLFDIMSFLHTIVT